MKFPKWQLHRGYWQEGLRENSLAALQSVRAHGHQMAEIDVRLSKDCKVHLYHDANLARLFQLKQKIGELTSDDLSIKQIPTLQVILEDSRVPDFLNIEVKDETFWPYKISKKVAEVVKKNSSSKKILISSFNPLVLFFMRLFLSSQPRALIVDQGENLFGIKQKLFRLVASPQFLNLHYSHLEKTNVDVLKKSFGVAIAAWTVNDLDKALELLRCGLDSVISDRLASTQIHGFIAASDPVNTPKH